MDSFEELKQRLYDELRQYGFAEVTSQIPGYMDVMKKGGVEVSAVPNGNNGSIRVDIFMPNSRATDGVYGPSNCGGREFSSSIETPFITSETFAAGLEKVISIASHRVRKNRA